MKLALGLILIAAVTSVQANENFTPATVKAAVHTGYIPDGFDTNDHVQIVAEGAFPNTCYRPASINGRVDESKKAVVVDSLAYKYSGMCLQMIVPFSSTVDVGLLKQGTYSVVDSGSNKALGEMKVRVAPSSSADDFLYAPVSQAYLKNEAGATTVTVEGEFSNSCLSLKDVVVNVQPKVIVVQPVSELSDSTDCKNGSFPFEKTVRVEGANKGRYLLHVRSLNGKAINNLVDLY